MQQVRIVLVLALLANISLAPLSVGLPTLVHRSIGVHGTAYSLISAARPAGNIIAVLGSEVGSHLSVLLGSAAGGVVMGVGYGFLGLLKSDAFLAAGIALLMAGLGNFFVEAYLTAYGVSVASERKTGISHLIELIHSEHGCPGIE